MAIERSKKAVIDGQEVSYTETVHKQSVSFLKAETTPTDELELDLEKKNADYNSQFPNWERLSDCFEGGGSIQNAADNMYLVKRTDEAQKKYNVRKKEGVYYNKCAQIIETFQGHLWRKEPERKLPTRLEDLKNNVDGKGSSRNMFFSDITEKAQVFGIYWVLVEFPINTILKEQENVSISDEQKMGLNPYYVPIDPRNVLDWGIRLNNGKQELYYVVIRENVVSFNSPFLPTEVVTQYRVLLPDRHQIWQYVKIGDKEEAVMVAEIPISLGKIPLVPFYNKKKKFGVGKSALADIAELNIELYNKHSARHYAEVMSAFPLLFLAGWDAQDPVKVSEDMGISNPDKDAKMSYVEISGQSIDKLRLAEQDILTAIYDIAMKQVRNTSYQREAAEAKKMDRLDSLSDLQRRSINFSSAEEQCYKFAGEWLQLSESELDKISVSYNLDYDTDQINAQLLATLLNMRTTKDLSRASLWDIMKEGEILPRNFDPEKEKETIMEEENETISFNTNNNDME